MSFLDFGVEIDMNNSPFGAVPTIESAEKEADVHRQTQSQTQPLPQPQRELNDSSIAEYLAFSTSAGKVKPKKAIREQIVALKKEIRFMELSLDYHAKNPLFCLRVKEKLVVYYRELWRLNLGLTNEKPRCL
jgi:hypothetical protein